MQQFLDKNSSVNNRSTPPPFPPHFSAKERSNAAPAERNPLKTQSTPGFFVGGISKMMSNLK